MLSSRLVGQHLQILADIASGSVKDHSLEDAVV